MNTCGLGVRGGRGRCMPEWRSILLPLPRLQGAHDATMFSQFDEPPLERGTTWSTVRFDREPQYWQGPSARGETPRRGVLRRCVSRGIFTYVTSRITTGRDMLALAECSSHSLRSIISAFSLSRSTTA